MAPNKSSNQTSAKVVGNKLFVDLTLPIRHDFLDASQFEKFLHDRIKVEGKRGQLGDQVKIQLEGELE